MPKRKPVEQKRLAGTLRPDRDRARAALPAASTRCPNGLSPAAQRAWRRLAPVLAELGLLTTLDRLALADLVTCAARLAECETEIDDRGILMAGYRGGWVKNPAIMAANQYRQALYRWCGKFGLTPADRDRLTLPGRYEEEESLSDQLFRLVTAGPEMDTEETK